MSDDLLDVLLSAATDECTEVDLSKPSFSDALNSIDATSNITNETNTSDIPASGLSTIHHGDTDSSDDDDNRDFENRKYNDSGRDIKHLLDVKKPSSTGGFYASNKATWKPKPEAQKPKEQASDSIFGIRVINPLVSSKILEDRMVGREVVPMARIKMFVRNVASDKDWVVLGAIVHKSATKTSQKGKNYCILTLSDLRTDLKTVVVFLFGSAYKELWKTATGTVLGILNPSVLELREGSKDEACLSVDNHQRVMILGQSKDMGTCKSTRKNGERCTAFVNTNLCEFCIYHVKQEYQKCSKRSELQSGFAGRGLNALRNKVLGKNQVFYAGKMYSAIPASKNRKQMVKDKGRMESLSGFSVDLKRAPVKTQKQKQAARLDIAAGQKQRDLERLRQLGIHSQIDGPVVKFNGTLSKDVSSEASKSLALDVITKLKNSQKGSELKEIGNDSGCAKQKHGEIDLRVDFKSSEKFAGAEINRNQKENLSKRSESKPIHKLEIDPHIDLKNLKKKFQKDTTQAKQSEPDSAFASKLATKTANPPSIQANPPIKIPTLTGFGKVAIDLAVVPPRQKRAVKAKQTAVAWIQNNGPIEKRDPNNIRGSQKGKKRPIIDVSKEDDDCKKSKIEESGFFSDRFKKLMAASSKHNDLLEQRDNEEQEKYFQKLEMKERMEEKMMTTYKVACKAVRCLKCKYTSFSATDMCKSEKHPLRVFDAMKRFFKCGNCSNRTVCLTFIPTSECKNCGSSKWEKTSMMREKKVDIAAPKLSIRGGEQKFTNSVASDANLDLMVPDES